MKKNLVDMEYISEQLTDSIKRIRICDESIDKDKEKDRLLSYYQKKYSRLSFDQFKYDFIDLFCGAGGLSVGLEQAGFKPIIAVDKDLSALKTYRFNRPWMNENSLIHDDIRKIIGERVFPHVPLIVGGPPCQGFSVANKQRKEHDERNELYKFYVHAVEQSNPEIFLMENVEGILKLYEDIKEDFEKIDYLVCEPLLLSPKEFGFPQSRRRAFILGISKRHKKKAEELYNVFKNRIEQEKTTHTFTLWDAIGDLPILEAKTVKNATNMESQKWGYTIGGFKENKTKYSKLLNNGTTIPVLNHRTKYNNDRDIQIFETLKPGEKSDAESIQDINPYKRRADIFRDKFDKLQADEPCKAITAHMYYDCNMYIHPSQARGLTPREAARVQGFPDDYYFLGTPNEWYRQIGNAVSPLMARLLGEALQEVLKKIDT